MPQTSAILNVNVVSGNKVYKTVKYINSKFWSLNVGKVWSLLMMCFDLTTYKFIDDVLGPGLL